MNKSRFRSTTEHSLDAKGRLNFPSRFKEVLNQYDSDVLMVAPWGRNHLRAFPLPEWEVLEDKLMSEGREKPDLARFIRYVVGGVAECGLDKQGRVQLPVQLRTKVNLSKNVMLVGMIRHVEIWDKKTYEYENENTSEHFDDFGEQLSQMGIF